MATAHKRTLFLQLVGLNKQDDTFHSMMESCASFDTLGVPSVENNSDEKAPRKTISKRVSQFKKNLSTTPAKKRESHTETTSPPEIDGEATTKSGDSKQKHLGRSESKSPAPRRGTGDTESHSDFESGGSEIQEVDNATVDGASGVSGLKIHASDLKIPSVADDSTKRKRRSFFGAFLLPSHNSNKTLEQQVSTRKLEDATHPLNESLSSKQQNETHPLNESLSSKQHGSPRTKLVRSKKLEVESNRSDEKKSAETRGRRSSKLVGRKKLEDDSDQSNRNKRASLHGSQSTLNQSKELDGDVDVLHESRSFDLPIHQSSSIQESQRSRLSESRTSLRNNDGVVTAVGLDTSVSPRRSPRSRKRDEPESRNRTVSDKRESRRSLSPRRRLKQPTSQGDNDGSDAAAAGPSLSTGVSPKKRGTSPRRKKASQNPPSLQGNFDVDFASKTTTIGSGTDTGNITRVKPKSHPGHPRPVSDEKTSEQNERPDRDENIQVLEAHDVTETSIRKSFHENEVGESNHTGEFHSFERKSRQNNEKSPRRSRSVAPLVRTKYTSKSRDLSLSPDKQTKGKIRESRREERRSDMPSPLKDLRSKLEQSSSEKRPRGSSKSLGPGRELSLKNMLEAAPPMVDRKCLTVVSPKDYEKKKMSTNEDGLIVDHKAPSPATSMEGLEKPARRISPKKSPGSRHRVTAIPETLKVSPRRPITCPTQTITTTQASSKASPKKSPSSSRTRVAAGDQSRRIKEGEIVSEKDARGRARSRVEQLKEENHRAQRPRSRSSSRHRNEDKSAAPSTEETAIKTLMDSPSKSSGTLNQSQSRSPGTTLERVLRSSSPAKTTRVPTTASDDPQRDSILRKSPKHAVAQRQEDYHIFSKVSPKPAPSPVPLAGQTVSIQLRSKISTPSTPEKKEVRRPLRPASKSPGRQPTQLHGQSNGQKVPGDSGKISKRNEHFIRKAMSARNIDGHQSHYFEIEELTKSGTVVKRKLKVVPAGDIETFGSMLLYKDSSRGALKHKNGQVTSVAAQLHIPDMDESQKSNLKVKYTEYNEISMLDNYVDDDDEESESIH